MNSGIQCFMSSWIIQNLVASARVVQKRSGVIPALRRLLVKMRNPEAPAAKKSSWTGWGGWGNGYSPSDIKAACQRINPVFRGYGQQDSFELIQALIEGVISETNTKTGQYTELDTGKLPLDEAYKVQSSYYSSRTSSAFADAISGVYLNEFRCTKCKHISYVFEFSPTLSLELSPHQNPGASSWEPSNGEDGGMQPINPSAGSDVAADLGPSIASEVGGTRPPDEPVASATESVTPPQKQRGAPRATGGHCSSCGWNGFAPREPLTLLECIGMAFSPHIIPEHKCCNCLANAPVEVRTSIFVPPKVLVIQLKRFSAGKGSWGGMSKDERSVEYTARVELSQFLSPKAPPTSAAYLFSAASLHGGSLFGGHYTAVVSDHSEYYYCNDSNVRPQRPELPSGAYVLVFEREDALQQLMKPQASEADRQ